MLPAGNATPHTLQVIHGSPLMLMGLLCRGFHRPAPNLEAYRDARRDFIQRPWMINLRRHRRLDESLDDDAHEPEGHVPPKSGVEALIYLHRQLFHDCSF